MELHNDRSFDLLHQFFVVFLGVWVSFVLSADNYSIQYAIILVSITVFAFYRLVLALDPRPRHWFQRYIFGYAGTLFSFYISILAINGASNLIGQQPSQEKLNFLFFIALFWIIVFELFRHRIPSENRDESPEWVRR